MQDTIEFDQGVPIVHVDHGIGRYEGLTRIELDGETREFVTLRYADDDRLHVPLHALHRLSRYNRIDCDAAPLHALGRADAWRERRDEAARDALATAARLLAARARHAALEGFGFDIDRERTLAACRDELERGGQVYWLHNDVASIERAAATLGEALPDAHVGVAHGQMEEGERDAAMQGFVDAELDALVATTIIESGIDVANANTIVVEDADQLGLAQLHQLRGRVGRGERRAHAVLLSPPEDELAADARKRLEAIVAHSGLGAGLDIARHDLDIRGAGELLGEEQSGWITDVGLALYSTLLEQSVAALREGGTETDLDVAAFEAIAPTTVDLGRPASIPERDIADAEERLRWYLAIDAAADEAALETLRAQLEKRLDRTLPEESARLFDAVGLRLLCRRSGIRSVELGPSGGVVRPREGRKLPGAALERQARNAFGASCRVDADGALHVDGDFVAHDRAVALVEVLVDAMADGERERVAAGP